MRKMMVVAAIFSPVLAMKILVACKDAPAVEPAPAPVAIDAGAAPVEMPVAVAESADAGQM